MASLLTQPPTECANALTNDLDVVDTLGFVRLLRQSDTQIFAGWKDFPGLTDQPLLFKLAQLIVQTIDILQDCKHNRIIISGCGTSGRIGFLIARTFNLLLKQHDLHPCFHYLISGGDQALLCSDELPEDDPVTGARELVEAAQGAKKLLVVGVTCGLSAPYVGGQLEWSMGQPNTTTVLLGFNPVRLARDSPVELWGNTTFRDVALGLQQREQHISPLARQMQPPVWPSCFVINPVVGPEPVTGSSRMKGGTATMILLEAVFSHALARLFPRFKLSTVPAPVLQRPKKRLREDPTALSLPETVTNLRAFFAAHHTVIQCVYQQISELAALTDLCGNALKAGGRVIYLGSDVLGVLGFIDASEMPDTFGTPHSNLRAFVHGGWTTVQNTAGDLSGEGDLFRISLECFEETVLSSLSPNDTVVLIAPSLPSQARQTALTLAAQASRRGASLAVVGVGAEETEEALSSLCKTRVFVKLPQLHLFAHERDAAFSMLAVKVCLNVASTGANVQNGTVAGNTMINLTLANNKLFHRSVGIVQSLSGVSHSTALAALLRVIHTLDQTGSIEKVLNLPISAHVKSALTQTHVIPLAILMASGQFATLGSAKQALDRGKNVRRVLRSLASREPHGEAV